MPMPDRRIGANDYRYAYQGQEKDPETGKEAFELRLWDGRIGRWLTTDPAGQYHSPYLGMGNNPISGIDPDGGWFGKWRAQRYARKHGGEAFKNETTGKWQWVPGSSSIESGYDMAAVDLGKTFGYAGFGKLVKSDYDIGVNVKLDAGFKIAKDKGSQGVSATIATITLFDGPINYNSKKGWTTPNDAYYIGKNGVFKGSLPSASMETGYVDVKLGATWKYDNGKWSADTYYGFGSPYTEQKIKINDKGFSVHFGLQEDWGESFGLAKGLFGGVSGKLNAKAEFNYQWIW